MRSEVQEHSTEMDVNAFWEKVAPKKKKKRAYWWFVVPFASLLLGLGFYFGTNYRSQPATPAAIDPQSLHQAAQQESSSASDVLVTTHSGNSQHKTTVLPKMIQQKERYDRKQNREQLADQTIQATRSSSLGQPASATASKKGLADTNSPQMPSTTTEPTIIDRDVTLTAQSGAATEPTNDRFKVTDLANLPGNTLSPITQTPLSLNPIRVPPGLKVQTHNVFSVLLQVGGGVWNPNFSSNSATSSTLSQRQNSETALESRQLTCLVQSNRGIMRYVQFGLQYTTYHSRINSVQQWTELKPKTNEVLSINYYSNGSIDTVKGAAASAVTMERRLLHHNKVSTIGIPIYLQPFSWSITPKLMVSPSAGLVFEFYQQSKGLILNEQASVEKLEAIAPLHPKFGVRCAVQLNVSYQMNRKAALVVSPYFDSYVTNIYQKDYAVQSKIQQIGLRVGYQQHF